MDTRVMLDDFMTYCDVRQEEPRTPPVVCPGPRTLALWESPRPGCGGSAILRLACSRRLPYLEVRETTPAPSVCFYDWWEVVTWSKLWDVGAIPGSSSLDSVEYRRHLPLLSSKGNKLSILTV